MIAVDIETTGLVPDKNSILAIGALDLNNPKMRFYGECRIFEGAKISDEALRVNGFTKEDVVSKEKQSEGDLVRAFLEWSQHIENRILVGQNISFDRDFLKAAAGREKLSWDIAKRTVDCHSLCYMHMIKRKIEPPYNPQKRRSDLNLDYILNYCGIPDEPKPHNALTGALSHAEVSYRLLYDRPLLPEFSQYPIPWQV